MKNISDRIQQFKYNSLEKSDLDNISDSQIFVDSEESLFFYSNTDERMKIEWATNSMESFFDGLRRTIDLISTDNTVSQIELSIFY